MIDLSPQQKRIIEQILDQFVPGKKVMVLGSRATDQAKPYSDLDIAIMGDEPLSLKEMALLKEAFAESDLPFRVDVIQWCKTSEEFRKLIEPELHEFK